MKKIKGKKITLFIIIIFILFILFKNFEFLFFKIKVCNNTKYNTEIKIQKGDYKKNIFEKITEKMFPSLESYFVEKSIFIGLNSKKCTDYLNIYPLFNTYLVNAKLYDDEGFYIKCKTSVVDGPSKVFKLNYGKYDLNIENFHISEYEKRGKKYQKCQLNGAKLTKKE